MECVVVKLTGEYLAQGGKNCDCFESDPFPAADFPDKTNNNRRFFAYRTIAAKLGMGGSRVKHAPCVQRAINEWFPKPVSETPVGFLA